MGYSKRYCPLRTPGNGSELDDVCEDLITIIIIIIVSIIGNSSGSSSSTDIVCINLLRLL